MKKKPLISVIVASYNYENYIKETLDSLVSQTDSRFEVIVVDDGSRDNSIAVVGDYVSKFDYIHLFTHANNENRGLTDTVKLGIEKSAGEYVAFCESDDYWTDDHVASLAKLIESNSLATFIVNDIKVLNLSCNNHYESYVESHCGLLKRHSGENIFHYMVSNYIPTFSAVCVKKEVLQSCDFDSPYQAWLDFWLWRQICLFHTVHFIPSQITIWRKHDTSYDAVSVDKDYVGFVKASNRFLISQHGLPRILEQMSRHKMEQRYPRWLVKMICCFVPVKSSRRYIRNRYIRLPKISMDLKD